MRARIASFAALTLLTGAVMAAPESYTIDPTHTFPSFEISHVGFSTHRGRFNNTTGTVVLDRQTKTANAVIVIDAKSIDTGHDKLEAHLRNGDFFDVQRYPTITFKSTEARFEGGRLVGLKGDLTMLGQTRPVSLKVNNFKCGNHPFNNKPLCSADVEGMLKRSDFGMKYGVPVLGDDVKLMIQVEAFKDA